MKTNETKKSPLNLRIQRLRGSVKTSLLTGAPTLGCPASDDACPVTDDCSDGCNDPGNTRGLGCVGGSGASEGSADTRC